jgi:hypothetical protein
MIDAPVNQRVSARCALGRPDEFIGRRGEAKVKKP